MWEGIGQALLELLAGVAEATIPASNGSWRWVLAWMVVLILVGLVILIAI